MTVSRNRPWPAHVRRDLRDMWSRGLSARQIADALNERHGLALTRNAVIGKVWRMGLRREPRKDTVRPRCRRGDVSRRHRHRRRPAPRPAPVKTTPPAPAPVKKQTAPAPAPALRGVTDIMKLKRGMCRWVEGGPGGWVWCGAPTDGGSWCARHRAIVFTKRGKRSHATPEKAA